MRGMEFTGQPPAPPYLAPTYEVYAQHLSPEDEEQEDGRNLRGRDVGGTGRPTSYVFDYDANIASLSPGEGEEEEEESDELGTSAYAFVHADPELHPSVSPRHEDPGEPGYNRVDKLIDERIETLASSLQTLELVSQRMEHKMDRAAHSNTRLSQAEESLSEVQSELSAAHQRECLMASEVGRLEAIVEATALQNDISETRLRQQLTEMQLDNERLRSRCQAVESQRDDALERLADAVADLATMEATLVDSNAYIQELRATVLDLKMQNCVAESRVALAEAQVQANKENETLCNGAFSLKSTTTAIRQALEEAMKLEEGECRKKIRLLQARWHPDKHVELKSFANEVSKIINQTITELGIKA